MKEQHGPDLVPVSENVEGDSVIGRIVALSSSSCPGPGGMWPCALQFGHPDEHVRLSPPNREREQRQKDMLLADIRALREERDALRAALEDSASGFSAAYQAEISGRHDEVLLHCGIHEARALNAIRKARQ